MEATLEAVERTARGKNESRRLRVTGKIPAVVYGVKEAGVPIAVDPKGLTKILQTELGAMRFCKFQLLVRGRAGNHLQAHQLAEFACRQTGAASGA